MTRLRHLLMLAVALAVCCGGAAAQDRGNAAALAALAQGTAAFRAGDILGATQHWSETIRLCRAAGAGDLEAQALARRGEAYRVAGYFKNAGEDLRAALGKAEASGDKGLVAAASGALGNLAYLLRRTAPAEPLLRRSRDLARDLRDPALLAAADNDLGNLYAATKRPADAASAYDEAIASADGARDGALAATAETNAARLALGTGDGARALILLQRAVDRIAAAMPSYARGMAAVVAGSALIEQPGALTAASQALAYHAFQLAEETSEALHNTTLTSLALGSMGRLYERAGRTADASILTERALFAAQQAAEPELSFRWEWQRARLARREGQIDAAIASYRRAVADLQSVRQDIPVEYREGKSSYLATFGPLYLEFTDLLLRQAAARKGGGSALLHEARDTVELLKESELQDYFRDPCVTSFEAKRRSIDTIAPGTAVLYPIVLPDRLELLVSFGEQLQQFSIPFPAAQLRQEVDQFRRFLEKRTTNEYLPLARDLYNRIIRPIDPLLAAHHVDTLVIVPDNTLRTIPFAALNDGQHFLIERYATAIVPSLKLVDPKPLTAEARVALAAGISESVGGQPGLPNAAREIADVRQIQGGKELLNNQFSRLTFQDELKTVPYNVVHIASHGQFGDDPSRTFVLAFDGRLTMDDLEQDIKFGQYRQSAIELLTLSACETAVGDDRSALGLAGIAIKSGARSALATLWFISDQASGELVVRFYRELQDPKISKAHALQAAQRELLADPVLGHPAYWAPFLLVGNWL